MANASRVLNFSAQHSRARGTLAKLGVKRDAEDNLQADIVIAFGVPTLEDAKAVDSTLPGSAALFKAGQVAEDGSDTDTRGLSSGRLKARTRLGSIHLDLHDADGDPVYLGAAALKFVVFRWNDGEGEYRVHLRMVLDRPEILALLGDNLLREVDAKYANPQGALPFTPRGDAPAATA